jgi:structural maintenance of chromosome 2
MRVQNIKEQIAQQEEIMNQSRIAKEKALVDCKRIESEMADFNNNKDTKLDQMTVNFCALNILELIAHIALYFQNRLVLKS